ncbi:MAG: DUF58 domain-containing protein [Pseudomonadota bacterium]
MAEATADPQARDPRVWVTKSALSRLGPQARGLSFLPRQPVSSVLNGRHASRMRGRGLDFEELRDYLPGDDIRSIDWKVTARTGSPHVRVYSEERDRPALILVDQRQSMFFGSAQYMKSVVAAEAAAISAQRILDQGDRVGGLVFGSDRIAEHRPVRSPRALTQFLSSIASANGALSAEGAGGPADQFDTVLRAALRIARKNALVLVISDFDGASAASETLVRQLARANDLVFVTVTDPMAQGLPKGLSLTVSDGGLQATLDTGSEAQWQAINAFSRGRLNMVIDWASKYGIPLLPLTTDAPALGQMMRLMGQRARR